MGDTEQGWYWDLEHNRAVPWKLRGPGDQMLGPYATRADAENWKATNEARNTAWDDADEEWNGNDDDWGRDDGG